MGAQGTAELDFGAFPGASDASVTVTGQAGIVSGSLVEAWIRPVATTDHTADEHMVETFQVFAHTIVAATGFTISGFNTSQITESHLESAYRQRDSSGGGTRIYGKWTIAWVWN